MKRIIYIIALTLFNIGMIGSLKSQQDPMFSQYMFDRIDINPAYCGSNNYLSGVLGNKQMFTDIEGGPKTQKFNFNAPIQSKSMGLGLKVKNDKLGVSKFTTITGVYAYHLGVGNSKLSFGLEGGISSYSMDFTNLIRKDPNDRALSYNVESLTLPEAAFGMYISNDNFYAGVSFYNMVKSELDISNYNHTPMAKMALHNYIMAGYTIEMGGDLKLEPSIFVKSIKSAPTQIDLNSNITWKDMISVGGTYRTNGTIVMLFRTIIAEKYAIGYSYDYGISKIAALGDGTHEISLAYQLKLLPPAKEKVIHPRIYN